jgi:hypothetical protein
LSTTTTTTTTTTTITTTTNNNNNNYYYYYYTQNFLKFGAGEEWRRSDGPNVCDVSVLRDTASRRRGISY